MDYRVFEWDSWLFLCNCQSGRWRISQRLNQPETRYGQWGNLLGANNFPDASIAYCQSDEIVLGGGGTCANPERAWVHDSRPVKKGSIFFADYIASQNGWIVNCVGRNTNTWSIQEDSAAIAYAVCMKNQ